MFSNVVQRIKERVIRNIFDIISFNSATLIFAEKFLYFLLGLAPHLRVIDIYWILRELRLVRIWDPWILRNGNEYKVFFLAGPEFKSPFWSSGLILSASSSDLKRWSFQGVALSPSQYQWSNGRMLAGSCYKENGHFYLFYSTSPKPPDMFSEAIGIAVSKDCSNWQKSPLPLLVPDYKYYGASEASSIFPSEQINKFFPDGLHKQFRDPYIFKCHLTEQYCLIFSASYENGHPVRRACVGIAVSQDIKGPYTLIKPLLYPSVDGYKGIFYEIERPQIIFEHGKYYLLFSSWVHGVNPDYLDNYKKFDLSDSSVYCYVSTSLEEPFVPLEIPIIPGSEKTGLYGTNFFQDEKGGWLAYGWYTKNYTLELSCKFPVIWDNEIPKILVCQ